jgi:hypothetical protein
MNDAGGSGVTQDQRNLLKRGLFWAVVAAGSWWLVSAIQNRVVTAIAVIALWAFFYAIFYRNAHKNDPS